MGSVKYDDGKLKILTRPYKDDAGILHQDVLTVRKGLGEMTRTEEKHFGKKVIAHVVWRGPGYTPMKSDKIAGDCFSIIFKIVGRDDLNDLKDETSPNYKLLDAAISFLDNQSEMGA